jgi:hypothetical protein
METSTTLSQPTSAKRPRLRMPLIIAACFTLYSGCDTVLGPGLVTGTYDRGRYAIITSQLRVGMSKADVERAFYLGLTAPGPVDGPFDDNKPGIGAVFVPFHMICAVDERYLRVVIDENDRVQSWDTKEGGSAC